ncbi:MAG: hypothetical protein JJE30_11980 [Desulfuromonadales bacterium]|nr:hypothetical protein [Desulfuromonadales bacterium]
MHEHDRLYINGHWVSPIGTQFFDVMNPATEVIFGKVPAATSVEAGQAVRSRRRA